MERRRATQEPQDADFDFGEQGGRWGRTQTWPPLERREYQEKNRKADRGKGEEGRRLWAGRENTGRWVWAGGAAVGGQGQVDNAGVLGPDFHAVSKLFISPTLHSLLLLGV